MTTDRISDLSTFMNNHAEAHEFLSATLLKARALSFVIMQTNLDECPNNILRNYFWALTDILTALLDYNERNFKKLLNILPEEK